MEGNWKLSGRKSFWLDLWKFHSYFDFIGFVVWIAAVCRVKKMKLELIWVLFASFCILIGTRERTNRLLTINVIKRCESFEKNQDSNKINCLWLTWLDVPRLNKSILIVFCDNFVKFCLQIPHFGLRLAFYTQSSHTKVRFTVP